MIISVFFLFVLIATDEEVKAPDYVQEAPGCTDRDENVGVVDFEVVGKLSPLIPHHKAILLIHLNSLAIELWPPPIQLVKESDGQFFPFFPSGAPYVVEVVFVDEVLRNSNSIIQVQNSMPPLRWHKHRLPHPLHRLHNRHPRNKILPLPPLPHLRQHVPKILNRVKFLQIRVKILPPHFLIVHPLHRPLIHVTRRHQ